MISKTQLTSLKKTLVEDLRGEEEKKIVNQTKLDLEIPSQKSLNQKRNHEFARV